MGGVAGGAARFMALPPDKLFALPLDRWADKPTAAPIRFRDRLHRRGTCL